MKPLAILSAIVLALSLAPTCKVTAQATNAAITGTVTDAAQAAVAGATMTAQNIRTGVVTKGATNETGIYLFPSLQPGVYLITVEKEGFRKLVYQEVTLEVGARINLDLQLQVGALTMPVIEVRASDEASVALGVSSVGGVVTGQMVRDLPVPGRDALGLVLIQAGVLGANISGARIGTLNITRDGIIAQDSSLNYGIFSNVFTSVDLVQEFRVVTSPADSEFGRGSAQIQMLTRSGTNQFHGSLFEYHRNTALNANTWFNNQRGRDPQTGEEISPRDVLIRNQFGGRIGGPIVKNRTFFHALFEGQRIATRNSVTAVTFTDAARRGIFRFFPGAQNGNANAAVPTVDLAGAPVRPAQATGDLQEANLFGRDPNRRAPDPSGVVQRMLDLMPRPNNFRFGDGLNTAGFTWIRRASEATNNFSARLDHAFNDYQRFSFNYTFENENAPDGFLAQPFPQSPRSDFKARTTFISLSMTSAFRPNLLNEFRAGALRPRLSFFAPWEVEGTDLLPKANNQSYLVNFGLVTDPINLANDPQGRISPVYQYANNLTWLKGRHGFKVGGELRFVSTNVFTSFDVTPRSNLGTGGVAIQNVNATTIPGIGANLGFAQALLNELSGSLASVRQAFNSPGGRNPVFAPGEYQRFLWKQREFSLFIKDDFKVKPALTLNLGVRYEYYGAPYDGGGKTAALVGGSAGIFGITGTSMADLFQPGRQNGSLTGLQLVGPGSPNPEERLYRDDWNNFAPAVGLSWAIPYFGKNKTILRMGYGWGYERNALVLPFFIGGNAPGLRELRTFTTGSYLDLSRLSLPLTPLGKPLDVVPLNDRTQNLSVFDTNLRTPYYQNWNVVIQRELFKDAMIEARYVGNKGTRLIRGFNINEVNIFETGILEAFRVTQAGEHSPLLDRIFMGLNIPGLGVVNGTTITGSDAVRFNATTQSLFANHNAAGLASYLNATTQFTGQAGGLLRRAGLPDNFIVANPQFASAVLTGNVANSTYHALQVEFRKRFSGGWQVQSNYTWSRALGEEEGSSQNLVDSYRSLRDMRLDKRLLSFHRTHILRNAGTWELPFGPKRRFLGAAGGLLARLVERWQVGVIYNHFSGLPIDVVSGVASFNNFGSNTPVLVGPFPKGLGSVRRTDNGVVYFDGLQQAPDPSIAGLTTRNNIRAQSALKAITDSSGRILLVNPLPGQLGTLGSRYLEGPGSFRFDLNLIKRVRIGESKEFEMRVDAFNVTNTPQFGSPVTDINSPNFGRITGAGGNRIIEVGLRFNF